jgi:hypothetical protein
MNALMTITPRKEGGVWLFDDEAAGLYREPFVAGIPEMIERLVAGISGAEQGFSMIFGATPFPGYQVRLDWAREEHGGNWYNAEAWGLTGWLCPALFAYFPSAPKTIYVQAVGR